MEQAISGLEPEMWQSFLPETTAQSMGTLEAQQLSASPPHVQLKNDQQKRKRIYKRQTIFELQRTLTTIRLVRKRYAHEI